MNDFTVTNPIDIPSAEAALQGDAVVLAGGTELIPRLRGMILKKDPSILVNIKSIPGLDGITIDSSTDTLKIGSLTTLNDIAESQLVIKHSPALAQAAESVGGPELRNMGTIGGNICQYVRCWYYRAEFNIYDCLRKGGGKCFASGGDHRYHSIFGHPKGFGCYAVNPSDIAPALIALSASIKTSNKKTIPAKNLFSETTENTTKLLKTEFITEIQIPPQPVQDLKNTVKSSFVKFASRKSIDFAIVNCAAVVEKDSANTVKSAVIWVNGVYITPKQAKGAEQYIVGRQLNDINAKAAGQVAFSSYQPLLNNVEIKWIIQAMVRKALVGCSKYR